MSRVILALLLLVAVASAYPQYQLQQQCGYNEQYHHCGSACQPTCADPKIYDCTYNCISGCLCYSGYLRNSANICVHPSQC